MKTEKIILSFVATIFGLLAAGISFYIYQATKTIPPNNTKTVSFAPITPTPLPSIFLSVDKPMDEEVVNNKIAIVSGKTSKEAVVTVITNNSEEVITPTDNGDFSTTITINDGQNILDVIALMPNGESKKVTKTVTYSLEEF